MANPKREPLARLSLNQGNRPLAGAPSGKGVEPGRLSLAGPGRRESLAPGRPSLAPGPQKRLSLSAAPSGPSALGNRRNSIAVVSKAADPRPIGKKEYTSQCVKIVLDFLASHHYDQPCNAKILQSPTKTDFKNIITFLFRQIDPYFDFGSNFEEEVRTYLKFFGYPIAISKVALTPVGSPHTWPHILAALVWLVEFILFEEEAARVKKEKQVGIDMLAEGGEEAEGASQALFFQHIVKSYDSFLRGCDNYSVMDEELASALQGKNKQAADHVHKLQARVEELKAEKLKLKNTDGEIKSLEAKRDKLKLDLEKLKESTAQLRQDRVQQLAALEATKTEYEQQRQHLQACDKQRADLGVALEKQQLTPLQVQQMSHQRQLLSDNLTTLEAQKETVQKEIWDQEVKNCKALFELEKRVKLHNECALLLELTPLTARHAKGVDFQLKMNPQKKDVCNMVGVDLTRTLKPAVAALRKQLTSEIANGQLQLREIGARLLTAVETRVEQERTIKSLEERVGRYDEQYRAAKEGTEFEIRGSLVKIEDVELEVSQMRAAQARILEESETKIHQLDSELFQHRQMHIAAREKMLREIHEMCERVFEHKAAVSRALKEVLDSVKATKESLTRSTCRTPGKLALREDR